MSFDTLGLTPELLRAVADEGYTEPTPVQREAIPIVLERRDLLAGAQTGTGKTAAFVLPVIQVLHPTRVGQPARNLPSQQGRRSTPATARPPVRVLVVVPTRELAIQVEESVRTYGRHRPIRSTTIYGGVGFEPQAAKLRAGPEIVVATPGRLLDHVDAAHDRPLARSRSSSSTRRTACSTWASSATSARSSTCCRPAGRTCCSRRPSPTTSAAWPRASSTTPHGSR